ncbi:MAG: type II toxin-antitoxin system Phd/YefM family antitoxin [Hoeflea sp.]|uniref:type II toxin-antitoxin system Phd/YefM family antitoxin n=1 Tax=Hoeflea sp. TaxID=1940281 RepID=UPI001D8A9276|nr:type II toxin-antitoxin system Phd/YefM family antitoxin [Hoeflea sp.]MBU4531226.1 type II toxin-antitoxin system Phd/YefM family antitoxin [Alphaproteobacteria bacterium]MBU4545711.1 type II toxin-antitoxin system Phd/YefM family antitoxin [Alphaproteobacteria bacterium]MBU4550680.1 type II toxin-antitoxin system Phd/YefM family antitoxin [Alphaproteobacteria bacterium]MBV1724503.1 type II toxin-antitoxin system Phd/YefM family antitoxin [Hoeflea sp.]MBV1760523.1 type II toxin-antitoxin sy
MTRQDTKPVQTATEQMPTFTATEARNKFSDIFNQAHYGGGVLIEKHGKRVAVVPLELLDRLADLEARIDSADAQRALDEFQRQGGSTLDELEMELEND